MNKIFYITLGLILGASGSIFAQTLQSSQQVKIKPILSTTKQIEILNQDIAVSSDDFILLKAQREHNLNLLNELSK